MCDVWQSGRLNLAALMNCGLLQSLFFPFNSKYRRSVSSPAGGAGGSNCCEVCFTLSADKAKIAPGKESGGKKINERLLMFAGDK